MPRINYAALQAELAGPGHPVTGAYNADNALAAAELNAENVPEDREFVEAPVLFEIILENQAEWEALTADDRQLVRDILSIHSEFGIPTQGTSNARATLIATLGAATRAGVGAYITGRLVSRASQLDLNYSGPITESHVAHARTL